MAFRYEVDWYEEATDGSSDPTRMPPWTVEEWRSAR